MRKFLLILMVMVGVLAVAAPKDKTGAPAISFATKSHDFGTVREDGGPVSCVFTFTNTGSAPLVIISATASCGCTRPNYPVEPVRPGKSAKIKVTYLPQGRPGEFAKTVKIRTNDPSAKKVTLKISGTVLPKK